MNKNIILIIIKLMDISLTGIYFFMGGVAGSYLISEITPTYAEKSDKELKEIPSYLVFIHICCNIALITIYAYLLRKVIKEIPFIFDGFMGYKHSYLPGEKYGTVLLAFALITYVSQDTYDKVTQLLGRFNIKAHRKTCKKCAK